MGHLDKLLVFFVRKFSDKTSHQVSLFNSIPLTYGICLVFGVPLCNPTKVHHSIAFIISLVPRIIYTYFSLKYDFENETPVIFINQLTIIALGFSFFFILSQKRSQIVTFLTCEPSLVSKFRRLELIYFFLFLVPIALYNLPIFFFPVIRGSIEQKFIGPPWQFCPTLHQIVGQFLLVLCLIWFQLIPLSVSLYSLGFCVLHSYKLNISASVRADCKCKDYSSVICKMQLISRKHSQFESIFGPFLFIGLCYNFLTAVYFIKMIDILLGKPPPFLFYFAAANVFAQATCFGMIFAISIYTQRTKEFLASISSHLEFELTQNSLGDFLMINYIRKKLDSLVNEPLTACKMITLDRQVILTIATSCVTFSVLLIQINNGALAN